MDTEALILDLMTRIQALKASVRTGDGADAHAIGVAEVLAELAGIRAEVRQDLAALHDELDGLRRDLDERFATVVTVAPHRPLVRRGRLVASPPKPPCS
ncbi:hypothetical protein [Nonomuraea sp. NPDC050643]|uniref:hypothetical protein n=1 Tax=Nonomuraea sp. NPDC050643 TaxID=3155660 RepID=UPI0033CA1572